MGVELLSKSEYRVAKEVAMGFLEKEIGDRLCISEKTVHTHTYRIRKKLKARNAVDVCRIFIQSLENPKQFFVSLIFLMIQFNIMFSGQVLDLRKPVKTSTRIIRTMKPRKNE